MQVSRRISNLTPSPTVALNAKAQELKAKGADILNFGVGEPDFQTPQPIVDVAIRSLTKGRTKYGPAGGGSELRRAIVDKLARENRLQFSPDDVVVGIGAKEILFHIFLAMLNEGDEVILPAPYWVSYSEQIAAAGATSKLIPMPEGQDIKLTPAMIEAQATSNTRCFVLTSPNNPAGYALNHEQLKDLGQYLASKDWWIVSDEIYEYLSFDHPHVSMLELVPELRDRFILVNGLSKGFAMTGWRVGYMAGPTPIAKLVRALQSHSSTCLPGFIEDAAAFALKSGRALVEKDISVFRERRDFAVSCVEKISGMKLIKPQGAFYLFLDLRPFLAKSARFAPTNSLAFSAWLLEEFHVAAVPGEAFGAPGFLRLSYAIDQQSIQKGIERLAKALTTIQAYS